MSELMVLEIERIFLHSEQKRLISSPAEYPILHFRFHFKQLQHKNSINIQKITQNISLKITKSVKMFKIFVNLF